MYFINVSLLYLCIKFYYVNIIIIILYSLLLFNVVIIYLSNIMIFNV